MSSLVERLIPDYQNGVNQFGQSEIFSPGQVISFSGEEGTILYLDSEGVNIDQPWIFEAVHHGSTDFSVTVMDNAGNPYVWPVTALGKYRGRHTFGFDIYGPTGILSITADGNWTLRLFDPLNPDSTVEISTASGTYFEGSGNDVYRFNTGGDARAIEFACESCTSSIGLYSIGHYYQSFERTGVEFLIYPPSGGSNFKETVLVPAWTAFLEIAVADNDPNTGELILNDWSIRVL